jgi:hypothetical protein
MSPVRSISPNTNILLNAQSKLSLSQNNVRSQSPDEEEKKMDLTKLLTMSKTKQHFF